MFIRDLAPLPDDPKLRRLLRVGAGLTIEQAAEHLEVSVSSIYRWETDGSEAATPIGRNRRVYSEYLNTWRLMLIERLNERVEALAA